MRIVVEIASLHKDPPSEDSYADAIVQLQYYLEVVGERWHKRLVGLAILGNRAYLMHITEDDHEIRDVYKQADDSDDDDQEWNGNWMSLFDPRVVEVLDEMYELSINDDDVDDDNDDDDDEDEGEDEDEDY